MFARLTRSKQNERHLVSNCQEPQPVDNQNAINSTNIVALLRLKLLWQVQNWDWILLKQHLQMGDATDYLFSISVLALRGIKGIIIIWYRLVELLWSVDYCSISSRCGLKSFIRAFWLVNKLFRIVWTGHEHDEHLLDLEWWSSGVKNALEIMNLLQEFSWFHFVYLLKMYMPWGNKLHWKVFFLWVLPKCVSAQRKQVSNHYMQLQRNILMLCWFLVTCYFKIQFSQLLRLT